MKTTASLFGDPITTNEVIDVMFKHYDQSMPFDQRATLPRPPPHDFVKGYILAVLEDWPFNIVNDISERTYAQMIRDCGYFFWVNRDAIGEQSFLYGISMELMGACFWKSRQGKFGGIEWQDWPYADEMFKTVARFDHVWVVLNDDPNDEHYGQLDYVWEDPNGFNFT